MATVKENLETLNTVIKQGSKEAASWEDVRTRYNRTLVGERLIVVDKHDRTFRQLDGKWELKYSTGDLTGVSHLTQENAERAVKALEEANPEAAPYKAVDFAHYADERAREARGVVITAQHAKDKVLAPFMNDARFAYWQNELVLNRWQDSDMGQPDDYQSDHTKHVIEVVAAAPFIIDARSRIHSKDGEESTYGPLLSSQQEEAIAVFRSRHGVDWVEELSSQWQKSSYPGMGDEYSATLQGLRNDYGPEWLSAVHEKPTEPSVVRATNDSAVAGRAQQERFLILEITETNNAAFTDGGCDFAGRDHEVGRIIHDAAEVSSHLPDATMTGMTDGGVNLPLHDLNGNSVGVFRHSNTLPAGEVANGTVRLVMELGNDAFATGGAAEVARVLREASIKVADGKRDFPLNDVNGNSVGKLEWPGDPSLVVDGRINLQPMISSGRLFKADDGYSGIADGEYRYVLVDYEIGYGEDGGPSYLVNAQGEVAPGYEDAQTVSKNLLSDLPKPELRSIAAVQIGDISFDEHERTYSGEEPELDQ